MLGDAAHKELIDNLKNITAILPRPSAIVVISAHWEASKPTITSGANPSLLYDYHGFPKESYKIQYPALGEPRLALKAFDLLKKNNLAAALDEQRGFDHGLFVPLKIMYPDARIPCIQLSLVKNLNPSAHIEIGKALAGLTKDNTLFLGSGFSFHNLQAFFSPSTSETWSKNASFEKWLMDTCSNRDLSEDERERRLIHWQDAPAARYCHPREEHLLPLHVCYGLTQSPAQQAFAFEVMGKKASAYLWRTGFTH